MSNGINIRAARNRLVRLGLIKGLEELESRETLTGTSLPKRGILAGGGYIFTLSVVSAD